MSEPRDELRRRLERATAAGFAAAESPDDELLDDETAALREGWVALGQLLEAACPAAELPVELPSLARRKAATWRRPAVVAVLVASLLVAATLAWSLIQAGGAGDSPRMAEQANQMAEQARTKSAPPTNNALPDGPDVAPVPERDELEWDDSFDDQLAMVGENVIRIQEDWYGLEDAFGPVQAGLEQVAEEMDSDSL